MEKEIIDKMEYQELERFPSKASLKWINLGIVIWALAMMAFLFVQWDFLMGIGQVRRTIIILSSTVFVILVHEGLHGLFFKIFGGKVSFGFKMNSVVGPAAYASSPNLFPRLRFQIVGLAPQILTLASLIALIFIDSPDIRYVLILIAMLNLGGGFLDLYLVFWLRKFPNNFLVKDTKEGAIVYKV